MLVSSLSSFDIHDYEKTKEAIEYLKNNDLNKIPLGRNYPDGKNFYVQSLEYDTEDISDIDFEVHRKRLDLHYVVKGEERIDVGVDSESMPISDYNDERDIQYVKRPNNFNQIVLHSGDFIVIGMNEPHRTNGIVNDSNDVHKLVLKLER